MHRTEGLYNNGGLFTDGPPGTRVEQRWLNSVQEEIAYIIEQNGLALLTADADTKTQLYEAIELMIPNNNIATASSNYTFTDIDNIRYLFVDTSGGNVTVTLPTLADNQERVITIKVIDDTNLASLDGEGAETIDGMTSIELPKVGDHITIIAQSSEWKILNEHISCQLRLDTYAGYGSTDNKIMRFTNSRENYGNMFSENHSTGYNGNAEGLEITINKAGKYAFTFTTVSAGSDLNTGLSLNSSQLTTGISTITTSDCLGLDQAQGSRVGSFSWQGYLNVNDIIRTHTQGTAAAGNTVFTATYIGS